MTNEELVKITITKIYELGGSADFVGPLVEGARLLYFGLRPTGNTKVSKLEELAGDLAVSLGVEDVTVKRMPGQGVVGIFIPRKEPKLVRWMDVLGQAETTFKGNIPKVPLTLGIDWQGRSFIDDLVDCPHLLIAGSTGGGKSVLLRSLIATIVKTRTAQQVQLVLSDSKGIEFSEFDLCRNLLYPRTTKPIDTINQMEKLVQIVDSRLTIFAGAAVKNIAEYNSMVGEGAAMPYIVLIIDELADIVELVVKEEGERAKKKPGVDHLDYITRKARAAGVHVIAAVQRPSVDVVKGVIKNNFPSRLTFKMPSQVDSRVVLDTEGAEHLLGVGDCYYKGPTISGMLRLHTGLATGNDIQAVLDYVDFQYRQGTFGNRSKNGGLTQSDKIQ